MIQDAFWGILIPFLGTSLGAGCVFFLKNSLRDGIQRALTGFAAGAMLYVVVEELIPEMSQGKHSNVGTVFFCGGLQRDDGAGCGTGVMTWDSEKMPKLLDRGDGRAYCFGRRTAEKRLFIERKVCHA